MEHVKDRFLRYVKIDTTAKYGVEAYPSTEQQKDLGRMIVEELLLLGVFDAHMDQYGYVYGTIPSNIDKEVPVVGFIAHLDTSPDCPGKDVKPRIVENYDGGKIILNAEKEIVLDPAEFPDMLDYMGKDLIVTDGTTLLGADDKAGVAEILAMTEYLKEHPEIKHGTIKLGFTLDEEVGRGVEFFDVEKFGAQFAYTVDGDMPNEVSYENFNAASAYVTIKGNNIHTGIAKGQMINSILVSMEFHEMLPVFENPMYTENYEGFYHLNEFSGSVEETRMFYLIRDHDMELFTQKKNRMERIANYLNERYGQGTVRLEIKDSYFNMRQEVDKNKAIIDVVKQAMQQMGLTPIDSPIRGGTDGARLSYMGLPCPNIGTGGNNAHGKYEYACVQSMKTMVEMLIRIAVLVAQNE